MITQIERTTFIDLIRNYNVLVNSDFLNFAKQNPSIDLVKFEKFHKEIILNLSDIIDVKDKEVQIFIQDNLNDEKNYTIVRKYLEVKAAKDLKQTAENTRSEKNNSKQAIEDIKRPELQKKNTLNNDNKTNDNNPFKGIVSESLKSKTSSVIVVPTPLEVVAKKFPNLLKKKVEVSEDKELNTSYLKQFEFLNKIEKRLQQYFKKDYFDYQIDFVKQHKLRPTWEIMKREGILTQNYCLSIYKEKVLAIILLQEQKKQLENTKKDGI